MRTAVKKRLFIFLLLYLGGGGGVLNRLRAIKKSRFEKRLFICGQLLVFIRIAARKAAHGQHLLLDERSRKLLSVFSW